MKSYWLQFWRNTKGVAAIEFVLIAPVLILLLFASIDAVFALSAKRKIALAVNSIADLAARERSIDTLALSGLDNLGRTIMTPFDANLAGIVISGITVQANSRQARVEWSNANGPDVSPLAQGATVQLPSPLTPGIFLIHARAHLPYTTFFGFFGTNATNTLAPTTITLDEDAYFRSRNGELIPLS